MTMGNRLVLAALLLLAGCGDGGSVAENQSAARQAPGEQVLGSETVQGVFTGWDKGDYVWARIKVGGREEFGAWSGPSPIDLFLDAHLGKPLTLTIETVRTDVPEAGGMTEVKRIAAASRGTQTAEAWWDSLSPEQRQDARIGLAGSLEPAPPAPAR
jgi:hypothetical protein